MGADLGVPLSDLRLLCVSVAGGEVRCFIDAIFGHSLGSGVSTRAGWGESRKTFTQFSNREKREKRDLMVVHFIINHFDAGSKQGRGVW